MLETYRKGDRPMTKKDECKALYNLNDDQADYLFYAALTYMNKLKELGGTISPHTKKSTLSQIKPDRLVKTHNMTIDMANAFAQFVLPFVWEGLTGGDIA
jgi:hypothetical protein